MVKEGNEAGKEGGMKCEWIFQNLCMLTNIHSFTILYTNDLLHWWVRE